MYFCTICHQVNMPYPAQVLSWWDSLWVKYASPLFHASQSGWHPRLKRKQTLVDKTNINEITGRKFHDYKVHDQVSILHQTYHCGKLEPTKLPKGPWKIAQVHIHRTVLINCRNYIESMKNRYSRPFFLYSHNLQLSSS